jgi:hypothetical protein
MLAFIRSLLLPPGSLNTKIIRASAQILCNARIRLCYPIQIVDPDSMVRSIHPTSVTEMIKTEPALATSRMGVLHGH